MEPNLTKQVERTPQARPTFAPRVDVFENGHEFLVVAEIPGADKASIEVKLEGGELALSALRRKTEGAPLAGALPEFEYSRSFSMPDTIDGDKVEAEFASGILRVKLPKRSELKTRKIEVRSS